MSGGPRSWPGRLARAGAGAGAGAAASNGGGGDGGGARRGAGPGPGPRSITEVGTSMESYYGKPVINEPVWEWPVPVYFLTGGIGGGCALLHGVAAVAGQERLARAALLAGVAGDLASAPLLIKDLGRPERFLNMLRVFKPTSPMSVGSWILMVSGGASSTAAVLELLGVLTPVKRLAEAVSFAAGAPLATYTGALLADTAVPVWHEARRELPFLFGGSALASAGAATALALPPAEAGAARRLAVAGVAAEGLVMQLMKRRLGFVGEVYGQGRAGQLSRAAQLLATAGAGLLAWRGRRSRLALVLGCLLVLAGELALRFAVMEAGKQSARDPRYTVEPQRERRRRKEEERNGN